MKVDGGGRGGAERDHQGAAEGSTNGTGEPLVAKGPAKDEAGPIGPFPSWPWVYAAVLIYGFLMILFLWVLTKLLDPGATP